jgi:hypothetical protein
MDVRLQFAVTPSGRPVVRESGQDHITLARFLEHESGCLSEVEAALTAVVEHGEASAEHLHEVWALSVTAESAEIEFEYDDEPVVMRPAQLLELVRAWAAFVRSVNEAR